MFALLRQDWAAYVRPHYRTMLLTSVGGATMAQLGLNAAATVAPDSRATPPPSPPAWPPTWLRAPALSWETFRFYSIYTMCYCGLTASTHIDVASVNRVRGVAGWRIADRLLIMPKQVVTRWPVCLLLSCVVPFEYARSRPDDAPSLPSGETKSL
jgi:hypothetical protein